MATFPKEREQLLQLAIKFAYLLQLAIKYKYCFCCTHAYDYYGTITYYGNTITLYILYNKKSTEKAM